MRRDNRWGVSIVAVVVVIAVSVAAFHTTFAVMARTWAEIGTYSHGFLIAPISLWLIWRLRADLARMTPCPAPLVVVLVLLAAALWGFARVLGIQVIEQAAAVAFMVTGIWALLGHRVGYRLLFPLAFLFMMVPVGDELVPAMMDITADSTVKLLELTGIPVYREGLYFVIPSGSWSVVEACSGVRYLVASFTLGLLYAYLTYRSFWRRLAFVALALAVPVVANSLRAYLIVMIGHLSDMKLAVGIDHLIYGWVFFGLVMLLLFWIGGFWVERDRPQPPIQNGTPRETCQPRMAATVVTTITVALVAVLPALLVDQLSARQTPEGQVELPTRVSGWTLVASGTPSWPVQLHRADQMIRAVYQGGQGPVEVVIGHYLTQSQDREVVSSEHRVLGATAGDTWRITGREKLPLPVPGGELAIPSIHLAYLPHGLLGDADRRLLVATWFRLGAGDAAGPLMGKLQQARALLEGRTDGSVIMLATPDGPAAAARLQAFGKQVMPAVFAALDDAAR